MLRPSVAMHRLQQQQANKPQRSINTAATIHTCPVVVVGVHRVK